MTAWRSLPNRAADARVVLGPVDVSDPAAPRTRVVALMAGGTITELVTTAVPFVEGGASEERYRLSAPPEETFRDLVVRDANGDRHPDVVLFRRLDDTPDTMVSVRALAEIFTVRTAPQVALARLVRVQVELAGVDNAADFDAALGTLGRYEPPVAGVSPARFIARLRYATPAEFRAAVDPRGLRLCTDFPDRRGMREKLCERVPRARLTDARIRGSAQPALGEFAEIYTESGSGLFDPLCQRQDAVLHCGAVSSGHRGVTWAFSGEGASLRLVEISPWAEAD